MLYFFGRVFGRVAQPVRALRSHRRSQGFESLLAHQLRTGFHGEPVRLLSRAIIPAFVGATKYVTAPPRRSDGCLLFHVCHSPLFTLGMSTVSPASIALGRTLLPWVLASTACYALATILLATAWRHSGPQNRLFALADSAGGAAAGWLVWMIWLIGPGYAALLLGLLSPRLMGLSQIDLGLALGSARCSPRSAWASCWRLG